MYYEENRRNTQINELLLSKKTLSFFQIAFIIYRVQSMIWLTDTPDPLYYLFDDDILHDGCAIVNFHQLHDRYGFIVYTPYEEQEVMEVISGMWDHSWADVLIVLFR